MGGWFLFDGLWTYPRQRERATARRSMSSRLFSVSSRGRRRRNSEWWQIGGLAVTRRLLATDRDHHNPLAFSELWRRPAGRSTLAPRAVTNLTVEIGQRRGRVGSMEEWRKVPS